MKRKTMFLLGAAGLAVGAVVVGSTAGVRWLDRERTAAQLGANVREFIEAQARAEGCPADGLELSAVVVEQVNESAVDSARLARVGLAVVAFDRLANDQADTYARNRDQAAALIGAGDDGEAYRRAMDAARQASRQERLYRDSVALALLADSTIRAGIEARANAAPEFYRVRCLARSTRCGQPHAAEVVAYADQGRRVVWLE